MKKFNLMQIIPSLESGGVERGTVDLANFLAKKNIESSIVSNGGKMQIYLDKRKINHYKLPVNSKNFFKMQKKFFSCHHKFELGRSHLGKV